MRPGIQVFGTYLEDLIQGLHLRGLRIESIISKVNPLTVVGQPDKATCHFCDDMSDESAVLDIKKNLNHLFLIKFYY